MFVEDTTITHSDKDLHSVQINFSPLKYLVIGVIETQNIKHS